jgi:UDP-GlcNAc:undecaprenyl-phosphate GlcNAc-1-phosphate transferase
MYSLIFLAIASFALCILITPFIRNGFQKLGILDRATEARKTHTSPVPRIGGICIALAYMGAFALLLFSPLNGASIVSLPLIVKLLPAAGVMFATGLIDDLAGLAAWQKLMGQAIAAGLAIGAGVTITGAAGHSADMWWSVPLTLLWLVVCANAFNLIDGVDGLATGVGLFATLTMFVAALVQNNTPLALATAPLAGALLGFLRYNFNPASIFLGDCGSLTIGFLLGCYGIIWSQKSATMLGMTAPLMALSIPLLDMCLAIGRRFLRHQPIFAADRNHIHHRLLNRGLSPRRVALILYGVGGIAAVFSLMQSMYHNRYSGLIVILFCAAAWIGVQHLGYTEFGAARQLVAQGTFRRILHTQLHLSTLESELAAASTEEECWHVVREAAKEYGFVHIRMQLGDCLYQEQFQARALKNCWSIRIPLSDSEYLNLSYEHKFVDEPVVLVTTLAQVLQNNLKKWAGEPRYAAHLAAAGG